jgi:hypothetical protein
MSKPAKTTSGKPAAPARKQTKQAEKSAVAMPAVAEVIRKSAKRSPVAQLTKAVAEKRPRKAAVPAPARSSSEVSAEQRRCYVEVAAYFIAERHGFTPGRENEDWIAAEAEIDRMLA